MTRRRLLGFALLAAVPLAVGFAFARNGGRMPFAPPPQPVCDIDAERDLGTVEAGTTADARFTVRNAGGSPLDVTVTRLSCHCLSVSQVLPDGRIEPMTAAVTIPPGHAATLSATVRVAGTTGQEQTQQVFLATTDPKRAEFAVRIRYSVSRRFHTLPAACDFGIVPAGQERTLDVVVIGQRDWPAALVPVVSGLPAGVSAAYQPGPPADYPPPEKDAPEVPVGRLRVTAVAPATGTTSGEVVLSFTGHGPDHRLTIPFQVRATAAVEASPAELFLPLTSSAGPVYQARVIVRRADREPATLKFTAPTGVTVECGTAEMPTAVHVLQLTADPSRATGRLVVNCRLTAGAETHELPVTVHVAR